MFNWLKILFVSEEKPASGVRARSKSGRYVADDKSTPDVNEAYTTKRVKKRGRPKKFYDNTGSD